MNGGKIEKLSNDCRMFKAENERLRKRDGNATIRLCYDDGNNPFARETMKVIDVGVADNIYVVESEVVSKLQSANADLQKRVEELEKSNAGYIFEILALQYISSQMHCAYCGYEMIDANPGDGGVAVRKLVIDHMEVCEKHPLFAARQRIRELEAEKGQLEADLNNTRAEFSLMQRLVLENSAGSNTEKQLLEAEVAEKCEIIRRVANAVEVNGWSSQLSFGSWLRDAKSTLSTPTGSKLLAKVEAAENLAENAECLINSSVIRFEADLDKTHAPAQCFDDLESALSAYRAAGESDKIKANTPAFTKMNEDLEKLVNKESEVKDENA